MSRVKSKIQTTTADDAATSAYSEMDSIKDELQEWFDNLHENFQNGSKGEALQSAIDAIESVSEVTVPDEASELSVQYAEYTGKIGRPRRRDTCVNMLNAAAEAARARVEELEALTFDDPEEDDDPDEDEKDEGEKAINAEEVHEAEKTGDEALTEDERDALVDELGTFADECDNAASEYENVEFPGMYG